MRSVKWCVVVALVAAAAPAFGQEEQKRFDINLGTGYTFALSQVRAAVGNGVNVNVGLTWNPIPKLGLQIEYGLNDLGEKSFDIPVAETPGGATVNRTFQGKINMQFVDVNLIVRPRSGDKIAPYVIAGAGYHFRPIEVTTTGVGFVSGYCNPYWYVCYPGGFYPVDKIVGYRSSADFGVDVGGGVTYRINEIASLYFEARYHFMWGPSVTNTSTGQTLKANGQFIPLTVGVRF